jgi:hypothetical protein
MKRIVFITLALLTALTPPAATAQQPQPKAPQPRTPQQPKQSEAQSQKEQKPQPRVVDRRKLPLADRPNLSLADVNTDIGVDRRVIVMMAALNIAGYDYESGNRQLSALRRQIREDLKDADPDLVRRLSAFFQKHRKGENDVTAVAPYLSLALSLTNPPAFTIDAPADRLPDEVREITGFARRVLPEHWILEADAEIPHGIYGRRANLRRARRRGPRNGALLPPHRSGSGIASALYAAKYF